MTAPFTPALRAELGKLDETGILDLLGEILEPSIISPFDYSEDFADALIPAIKAYHAAYKDLACVAAGEHIEPAPVGLRSAWL